jgi:hypothetical protein
MLELKKLSAKFLEQNPNISLNWVIAGLVTGKTSLEQSLKLNQNEAERTMKQAGYIK